VPSAEPPEHGPYLQRGRGVAVSLVVLTVVGGAVVSAPPVPVQKAPGGAAAASTSSKPRDAGVADAASPPDAASDASPPYVELDGGTIRVKVGFLDGRVVNVAPEHDDCAELARRTGRPVKAIWAEALARSLH